MASRIKGRFGGRVIFFGAMIIIAWLLLLLRLFSLQVVEHDKYQKIVTDQLTYETNTTPERGKIYDTNGNLLVTNTTVYRIFISPYDIAGGDDVFDEVADEELDMFMSVLSSQMPQSTDAQLVASELSEILGVDYDTIMEKIKKVGRRDETIKKNVDPETANLIRTFITEEDSRRRELNKQRTKESDPYYPYLSEMIHLSATSKRYYCYGDLACHVLGFTNSDGDGTYGVEATYNDYLKGVSGKYITAKNALQQDMPFKYESYVGAENGANLVITIDIRLQYELENQVKAAYQAADADERAVGIAMDPNTGAILALAVYPPYDCNDPYTIAEELLADLDRDLAKNPETKDLSKDSEEYAKLKNNVMFSMWNNKAVTETYEPGSTFKILTAAIGLEEGAVTPDDPFTCRGTYRGEGFSDSIPCHRLAGHGDMTFARGLQQSCNPTMMQTAERVGLETFYKYFEALGYKGKTGVDLPGEVSGIFHAQSAMHATELAVYSFGQTFKCTPLQQLTAICSVANGGYLVTPHVLKEMVDDDNNVIYSYETEEKLQIFSEETCNTVLDILAEGVATDGGAKNAYVKGYSVAGKTGTSQKQDKWRYYDDEGNLIGYVDDEGNFVAEPDRPYRIGSTVGIAPADDPQIAVIIIVDEPTSGNNYGSVVAAPYISKFLESALPYLGIDPVYSEEELAMQEHRVVNFVGIDLETACLYVTNRKIEFKIIGKGDTVTAQVPNVGSMLVDNGVIYFYTDERQPSDNATVPDLIGKSAEYANKLLSYERLNLKLEGSLNVSEGSGAVVVSQSIEPGTKVPRGTIVTLEMRHMDGTD